MIQATTVLEVAQRFEEASRLEPLEGATFSGGEPMQQAEALLERQCCKAEVHTLTPS
jgi:pyruvate-formate lyase-activating enzyme